MARAARHLDYLVRHMVASVFIGDLFLRLRILPTGAQALNGNVKDWVYTPQLGTENSSLLHQHSSLD
jgi:hypothetical protein